MPKIVVAKNGSWVYSGDPENGGNQATAYTSTETQGHLLPMIMEIYLKLPILTLVRTQHSLDK